MWPHVVALLDWIFYLSGTLYNCSQEQTPKKCHVLQHDMYVCMYVFVHVYIHS